MTHTSLAERITRSLAYMLRHRPDEFDLELDRFGFADLDEVVRALNERLDASIDEDDLLEAIEAGDRQRYEIENGRIRALYGHSIDVDPGKPTRPPEFLYLGVGSRDADRARRHGLRGGRRRFLHLAKTLDDAVETGRRIAHEYAVIRVRALEAWEEGVNFYDRGELFLADSVPTEFLDVGDVRDDGAPTIVRREERGGGRRGERSRRGDETAESLSRRPRRSRVRNEEQPPARQGDRFRDVERHERATAPLEAVVEEREDRSQARRTSGGGDEAPGGAVRDDLPGESRRGEREGPRRRRRKRTRGRRSADREERAPETFDRPPADEWGDAIRDETLNSGAPPERAPRRRDEAPAREADEPEAGFGRPAPRPARAGAEARPEAPPRSQDRGGVEEPRGAASAPPSPEPNGAAVAFGVGVFDDDSGDSRAQSREVASERAEVPLEGSESLDPVPPGRERGARTSRGAGTSSSQGEGEQESPSARGDAPRPDATDDGLGFGAGVL